MHPLRSIRDELFTWYWFLATELWPYQVSGCKLNWKSYSKQEAVWDHCMLIYIHTHTHKFTTGIISLQMPHNLFLPVSPSKHWTHLFPKLYLNPIILFTQPLEDPEGGPHTCTHTHKPGRSRNLELRRIRSWDLTLVHIHEGEDLIYAPVFNISSSHQKNV
jgi:hypothetical protein